MSDESREQRERADEQAKEDVEAHSFGAPEQKESREATEEPPDVEGHNMGAPMKESRQIQ